MDSLLPDNWIDYCKFTSKTGFFLIYYNAKATLPIKIPKEINYE